MLRFMRKSHPKAVDKGKPVSNGGDHVDKDENENVLPVDADAEQQLAQLADKADRELDDAAEPIDSEPKKEEKTGQSKSGKDDSGQESAVELFNKLLEKIKTQRKAEEDLYNSDFDFKKHLFPHLMFESLKESEAIAKKKAEAGQQKSPTPETEQKADETQAADGQAKESGGEPQQETQQVVESKQSQYTNRSKPMLDEIRAKLKEAYDKDPSLYYEHDMNNAMTNDWYLKRYLLACRRNVQQTAQMVLGSFALRRQQGFRDHDWNYFPNEAHSLGAIFTYAPDKEGNITLYMRIRVVFKDDVMQKIIKLYSGKYLCELEELLDERVTCIVDFQGTGWANADLDLLFFSLNFLSRYTPRILRRILIVDMPWIFRAAYKTIQRFLPEDQRNFLQLITREQLLQEVIDPANAPDFLGGTCSIPYSGWTRSHPHSSSWIDFGFTNFSEYTLKRAHRFAKLFIPFFLDDKFRSDYYVLLIEMLERALKLYGSKATCQDVIDRYPRIKELQSFERLEYMCRVLDAAGEIPDDSIGSLLATEAKPVPAQSDSGEPDDKSAPANQSDPVSTRIQPSDRKIAKETTLKAADSIAVS